MARRKDERGSLEGGWRDRVSPKYLLLAGHVQEQRRDRLNKELREARRVYSK
jgi:hypothetical protein